MWETFFGFKKTPFADNPDGKQLFASQAWQQVKTRLEFLAQHRGVGLLTGEVGSGKSTAARAFTSALPANQYKILYVHFSAGSALDLLRQIALELNLTPARLRGDLVRQIAEAVVRLNQAKKQHPLLICDEAQLLPHPALEQLPLLLNFDMDSSRYLTLLLIGQPLLRRTLSLQLHEALRQRVSVHYHLEGVTREELDAYLTHQLKAAGVTQPLFDEPARQALSQAPRGILRKVNKLAVSALRLAAERKVSTVDEALLLDAVGEVLLCAPPQRKHPRPFSHWRNCSHSSQPRHRRVGSNRACCRRKAFCLWAESPRWARVCSSPISRYCWPPARSARAFRHRPRAVC